MFSVYSLKLKVIVMVRQLHLFGIDFTILFWGLEVLQMLMVLGMLHILMVLKMLQMLVGPVTALKLKKNSGNERTDTNEA